MPSAAFPARSTPFPNRLLDDFMPILSDTEWRVLCVVARQTLGWEDGQGGRKAADWLTQSQLKARTGRASEAVSRAIDGLVRKGLIQVCSEAGEVLATPQARQRCTGRMLFGLAPQALDTPQAASDSPCPPLQRPSADKQGISVDADSSLSEQGHSQSEQGYSVSELRKANTTKETQDKSTPGGVPQEELTAVDKPVENSLPDGARKEAAIVSAGAASDVRRFLRAYQEQFSKQSARGEPPPLAWGRDGKLVKGLLAQYGYARLLELLTRFFQSEDAWVRKRGYALSCFPALLPTLLMEGGGAQGARRSASATPVVARNPSPQYWQQASDIAVSDVSLFERYPRLRDRVRGQPP